MADNLPPPDQPTFRFGFILSTLLGNNTRYNTLRKYSRLVPNVECVWAPVRHFYLPHERDPVRYLPKPLHTRAVVIAQSWPVMREYASFDAIMVHQFEMSSLLALRPRSKQSPILINAHDNPPVLDPASYPLYPEQRNRPVWRNKLRLRNDLWAARRAGYFIGFSEWSAEVMRQSDLDPSRAVAQHVGLDLEVWTCAPRAARSSGRPRLLFVGGDFARKGGEGLLRLFTEELSSCCSLDIVTKSHIAAVPPNCRVHNDLGAGDAQLIDLFRRADIFVFPTEADLVPWVILEAMASNCAIISSRIGGIPDMVTSDCGILIDPLNTDQLRATILSLIADPEKCAKMGDAARRRIEQHYDAAVNVPKIFEIMKSWVNEKRRTSRDKNKDIQL